MSFKEWYQWFKATPWAAKWFLIILLLRPIIDNFYYLKHVNPLYSPLYIVGILTPILIFLSLFLGKLRKHNSIVSDNFLVLFGTLVFLNSIFFITSFPNLKNFGESIKYITPILLFLYLRYIIKSRKDLDGVLTTFLYSGIYILGLMLYENFINPVREVHLTEGRGGGLRMVGAYNDMMNYAIYITVSFLIAGYFFIRNNYYRYQSKYNFAKLVIVFALCILGLISIKHVATWAVFLALAGLIVVFNLSNLKGFIAILFIVFFVSVFYAQTLYETQIAPLISKEMNVVEGETSSDAALNGRVGRWERYFGIWNDMPFYNKLIGIPSSGHEKVPLMVSAGMHSDYVRVLFLTGIIGLGFYLVFLFLILMRSKYFRLPERFLIIGAMASILLHSVSTLPLLYSSYMYILLSIFSFCSLKLKDAYGSESISRVKRISRPKTESWAPSIPKPAWTISSNM